jgi:hypothetical protein
VPILLYEVVDSLGALAGVGTCVRDGSAEPDVIAYVVDPAGVLEKIIHVGLANAIAPVDVTSLVRSVPFRHLLLASW